MCLSADVQIYTKYMHCMLNTFCVFNDAKYSIIVSMVICGQLLKILDTFASFTLLVSMRSVQVV